MKRPHTLDRPIGFPVRAVRACCLAMAVLCLPVFPSALAGESDPKGGVNVADTLKNAGREIGAQGREIGKTLGRAFGNAGRETGDFFRNHGKEIGKDAREFGKETGEAFKAAGKETGKAARETWTSGHNTASDPDQSILP